MYEITKEFHFSAAHSLPHLPTTHQCHRLHGHNYIVVLVLRAEALDATDFVRDYGELSDFKEWLDEALDHRNLNEVVPCLTTAENLARWMFQRWRDTLPELYEVRVSETPKTWASYRAS